MTQSSFKDLPPEVTEQWRLLHEEAKARYEELAPAQSYVLPSIIAVALLVFVIVIIATYMFSGGDEPAATASADGGIVTAAVPSETPTVNATGIPSVVVSETAVDAQGCKDRSAYQITIGNEGAPHRVPEGGTDISQSPAEVSATWVITNSSQIGCVWEDVKVQPLSGELITPTLLLYPNKDPVQSVEPGQAVDLTITIPVTDATSMPSIQWVLILNGVPLFGNEEQYLTVKDPWIIE